MSEPALLRGLQHGTQRLVDIIFPPQCAGCKRSGTILCTLCMAQFGMAEVPVSMVGEPHLLPLPTGNAGASVHGRGAPRGYPGATTYCQRCGTLLQAAGGVCWQCQYQPVGLSGLRAIGSYQGPLRSCIHALKYDGNTRLAEPLGRLLAEAYRHYGMQADAIIAVPLHKERQQQRGYNHAHLLAEVCAKQVQVPLHGNMVIRHRATPAQVGLMANERHQNVAGAFLCTPAYATGALFGRRILIIDDVCTTGATLEACAAPLFAAGAQTIWGLVLARPL